MNRITVERHRDRLYYEIVYKSQQNKPGYFPKYSMSILLRLVLSFDSSPSYYDYTKVSVTISPRSSPSLNICHIYATYTPYTSYMSYLRYIYVIYVLCISYILHISFVPLKCHMHVIYIICCLYTSCICIRMSYIRRKCWS